MKKFYITCILILLQFNFGLIIAQQGWFWQNPLPQGNYLRTLHFINSNTGWVAGDFGTIMKTTDGGISWIIQTSQTIRSLNSIYFTDQNNGCAVGDNGTILSTSNSGLSWTPQESGTINNLSSVNFIDQNTGWAVGGQGTILKTTNGGANWVSQISGLSSNLNSVQFINSNIGWTVGSASWFGDSTLAGTILKTTDGGLNWIRQLSRTSWNLNSVSFIDQNTGWIAGGEEIQKTTNGGTNWEVSLHWLFTYFGNVFFVDLNTGWAMSGGVIWKTTDGGINWKTVSRPSPNSISFYFIDSNNGWGIGGGGSILNTTNGGTSWTIQTNSISYDDLHAIDFTDYNTGWAVGFNNEKGIILKTINGGTDWTYQTSGINYSLNSVCFMDQNTGWTVGDGGTILHTTNGGTDWIPQSSGIADPLHIKLYSVHFIDFDTGWIVGYDESNYWGIILKTTNGGTSWVSEIVQTSYSLFCVYFIDQNNGWICGYGTDGMGKILKTTNGGIDWIPQTSGTYGELSSIHFIDSNAGWAVGMHGTILSTTNGGSIWTSQSSGTPAYLTSVFFIDKNNGWITGANAIMETTNDGMICEVILRTTNGGLNWIPQTMGTNKHLTSIYFLDNGTGWAIGQGGTILKTIHEDNDTDISCSPGIISYWRLDETSTGTYADFVGNNTAGTTNPPIPVAGKVNGAQKFNGITTKINVPPSSSFDFPANGSFSVEFWYKGNTTPATVKCAIGRYIGKPSAKWWVGLNALDGRARFYMSSGGSSAAVNGKTISDGNWHHVAATRNGLNKTLKIYVDGVLDASTLKSFSVDFASPTIDLNIGWFNFQSAYTLDGCLDEVAIYNQELNYAVIQEHYNKGLYRSGYCEDLTPPHISSIPVTEVNLGKEYMYDVEATGNPGPVYSLLLFPNGMTIDTITGLITWKPSAPGNYPVSVKAGNGINPYAVQTFDVSVVGSLVCPPAIVSYWKLDETDPDISKKDEINLNNAQGKTTPVAGKVNGAQQFNNSKLVVPSNSAFDFPANGSFSVEFWYKGNTIPSTVKCAVGRYIRYPSAKWWVGLNALDGRARFYMSSGGSSAAVNGKSIIDGNWHHVAATRNGTTGDIKIYVDGVLNASTKKFFTVNFSSTIENLDIGWYSFQSAYALTGILDEISIHMIELSSVEILKHYNKGLIGEELCELPQFTSAISPLIKLEAAANNKTVLLNWQSSVDITGGFTIERKDDEVNTWKNIATVNSVPGVRNFEYTDNSISVEGDFVYRIVSVKENGDYIYSNELTVAILPLKYNLLQNYPNPFNPVTQIKFSIPKPGRVIIKIYNQLGEEVAELTNQDYETGSYTLKLNASNLASGIYLYRMEAGEYSTVKKFVLLK